MSVFVETFTHTYSLSDEGFGYSYGRLKSSASHASRENTLLRCGKIQKCVRNLLRCFTDGRSSRRPQSDSESVHVHDYHAKGTTVHVDKEDELPNEDTGTAPAEETMADQQQDPDIGPILRQRIAQNNQPRPEGVITESEATKVLWGQRNSLVIIDGVLYRKAKRCHQQTSGRVVVQPHFVIANIDLGDFLIGYRRSFDTSKLVFLPVFQWMYATVECTCMLKV